MIRTLLLVGASAMAFAAGSAEAVTFAYTGGVQHYTAVANGYYSVNATGARGGSSRAGEGGLGVSIGGYARLDAAVYDVIVGGAGRSSLTAGGGGGGTFIMGPQGSPVAVGGGGGGAAYSAEGGNASFTRNGTRAGGQTSGGGAGGLSGAGGAPGSAANYNAGGGAGVLGSGGNGAGNGSGTGGSSGSSFAGGSGFLRAHGGFGGGGGGGFASGGGGGGFSGGGGGSYSGGDLGAGVYLGGGGGGSYFRGDNVAIETSFETNGSASIEAIAYLAEARVTPALRFVTRANETATAALTITNAAIVSDITDSLGAIISSTPSWIEGESNIFLDVTAGQPDTTLFTYTGTDFGILSGNIEVRFASIGSFGGEFLPSATVPVTAIVTEAASCILSASGAGQLTDDPGIYFGDYAGTYLLDFGNVTAGSIVLSQLSLFNTVTASAFSETLAGGFAGPFDFGGFSSAGSNFSGIVGGTQGGFNVVRFNASGQSLGLHSEYFEFSLTSNFAGLDPLFLGLYRIGLRANVVEATVAGVPEPATWGLMIAGFGMIGTAMRRQTAQAA